MTIYQLSRMTKAERDAFLESGGKPTYPLSFWLLLAFGIGFLYMIVEAINRPLTPAQIERNAEYRRADNAEFECLKHVQNGARIPSTFELDRTGAKKNEAGYLAQVDFSTANAFGVRFSHTGICQITDGKVVQAQVFRR